MRTGLGLGLGHHGPEPLPVLRRRLLVAGTAMVLLGAALTVLVATPGGAAAVQPLTAGRRRLHWMVGAVCLAAAVALSRTYLSAHWLTDVLDGSLLGAGLALGVPEAVEVARDRRRAAALSRPGPSPRSTAAS